MALQSTGLGSKVHAPIGQLPRRRIELEALAPMITLLLGAGIVVLLARITLLILTSGYAVNIAAIPLVSACVLTLWLAYETVNLLRRRAPSAPTSLPSIENRDLPPAA